MIRVIVFDFDGVILQSAGIKTEAMRELFQNETPSLVEAIVDYHVRHMGISRIVKIRHVYEHILKRPIGESEVQALGRRFSEISFHRILKAPFIPGALEFLESSYEKRSLFVASGSPQEELMRIIRLRNLEKYFRGIYGYPREKIDILRFLLRRYRLKPWELLFVGDAASDWNAAGAVDALFIGFLNGSQPELGQCPYKVKGLDELDTQLALIEEERA